MSVIPSSVPLERTFVHFSTRSFGLVGPPRGPGQQEPWCMSPSFSLTDPISDLWNFDETIDRCWRVVQSRSGTSIWSWGATTNGVSINIGVFFKMSTVFRGRESFFGSAESEPPSP